MERNILKIIPLKKDQAEILSCSNRKGKGDLSLPFMVNSLLVCAEPDISFLLADHFEAIHNLIVHIEPNITQINTEVQLVLLVYSGDEQQICSDLEKSATQNIPAILIGDDIPASVMRKMIQHQVNDFIPLAHVSDEIGPALFRWVEQLSANLKMAPVVSIINGKGGSGASFITDCIGQICAQQSDENIVLFDADFQHGTLAESLGLEPEYYLTDALREVQELDAVAIKSMMCSNNNLSLLPVKPYSHLSDSVEITPANLNLLVNKIRMSYQLVVVDFSRGLDAHSLPILDISEVILVVVQQNIVSIREAKALIYEMKIRMGIKFERIHLIVNRFSHKHSSISVAEIKHAVGIESALIIRNNYELASARTDFGKPLRQMQNSKPLQQDIERIVSDLLPISINRESRATGFWSRFTHNFKRNK